ncbi:MAG: nucleotide sugar dehydrogenase [Anaerolineae bacterium]
MTGQELLQRIASRQARVGVVGLGYVGLPLAVAFAEAGFRVTGIETNPDRVAQVLEGRSYIPDVPSGQLAAQVRQGRLTATGDYAAVENLDTLSICVPTPLGKTRDPDMSYVVAAADAIAQHTHAGQLVVLESTTYPGTTEEVILPRLERANVQRSNVEAFRVGTDFFLAFSPERIDPGRRDWTVRNTPKVIGGVTPRCLEVATALYRCIVEEVVPVSSPRAAEMVKLLENTFRAVNIALVNEVAIMCDHLGLDVWEVIEAAATKPFGFMPFYPGPGLGGHCVPVDPQYLSWKLRTLNYNARFIQLASEINAAMPRHVVGKIATALNDEGKALRGSLVLILGVAYKRDVSDVRESPALDIIRLLWGWGAEVRYHDPHVPTLLLDGKRLASVSLDGEVLAQADVAVIVTDHATYDWTWVLSHARLVVDTRNATGGLRGRARLVKL